MGHRPGARLRRGTLPAQPDQRRRPRAANLRGRPILTAPSGELLRAYAPDAAPYRLLDAPAWLDEIDLSPGKAHVRMGTHALDESTWLLTDGMRQAEIALRRRLLSEQRASVLACNPAAEAAAAEALGLVAQWLTTRGMPADVPDGETHPLALAGSMVQEDLCVMVHHDRAWHLEGAVLCFPSLWVLGEKLGHPTSGVHAPVPYYDAELRARVDRFFDRLTPEKPVWRRNFSLWPELLLWAPMHSFDTELCDRALAGKQPPDLWIRSERQTLRRLPDSGAILFTIRVQMAPIAVLASRADRARDLAEWLSAPAGEARLRQMGPSADLLLSWLSDVGAATD